MSSPQDSSQHTLLVVDDEPVNLALLNQMLSEAGHDVRSARDGASCLEIASLVQPDLILLDVMMPEMDGFETCLRLKALPQVASIPVIFVTALTSTEDKVRGFDVGGVDFVTKPINDRELLARVDLHLRLRSTQQALARQNALLAASERRFRAIFNEATVCIALIDAQGHYLDVNAHCLGFFGYSRDEMLTMDCFRLNHPDYLPSTRATFAKLVSGELPSAAGDKRFVRKDGREIWVSYWMSPIRDERGACEAVVCVLTDLTDRMVAEREIRKLSRAVEQSHHTVVITDADANIEYVNPAFTRATGYTAEEARGQNPRMLKSDAQTPEFYQALWETLTRGETWQGEFQNRRKDGTLYWEQATISPLKDDAGNTTHFLAVKEDITARKKAEDEARLAATVFDTAGEAIMVSDARNQILAVNPSFTRITGYEADEVLGKDPKILASGRHDPAFYHEMWIELATEGHWRGEIWNRRKDGTQYPERLSIATVRRPDDSISHYVAVFSDITTQKQLEELLRVQAFFDPLTRLPNRSLFHDRLRTSISRARRRAHQLALLFIDLDGFKAINDELGHESGDRVLVRMAARFKHCVRDEDTVARLGGDEFAIILSDQHDYPQLEEVARRLLEAAQMEVREGAITLHLSASVGIALYPLDGEDGDTLLRVADHAMYEAKRNGKNTFALAEGAAALSHQGP